MHIIENKNILHVITVSFVINHFFGNQFKYLKGKTGNTYYLACSDSEEFQTASKELGYQSFPVEITRNISPITDIIAIFRLYKFIKANNIDTVVGHTPKGGMVAMIASYLAGTKNRIYFRHGIIYETSKGFKRSLLMNIDKLSGLLANKVVCVSNSVKEVSNRDHLNDVDKNIVLGKGTCNGIDTESKYNPDNFSDEDKIQLKEKWGIQSNDVVVGYVGRLVRDKGIDELIQAWKLLNNEYSNLKLLLVGPIEERDSINEFSINEIKNNPTIIHTDFVNDATPFFSIMDIFVLPTYREGFPTVSLEASSMAIPVIITRATGCSESIIDGETGIFVKNEPEDIKTKIVSYLENDNLRKEHGANGRTFVREYFQQNKVWDLINEKLGY